MDFTFAWILWGVAFAVIEGFAIFNKKEGDTLSEHVWEWFDVRQGGTKARVKQTVLGLFMAWLSVHFVTAAI